MADAKTPKTTTKRGPNGPAPEIATGSLPEGFTPPEPARSGKTVYPIDDLAVGGAFGVKNKTKRDLAGVVARANAKYRQTAKDADGKTKVLSTDREFYAVDVDAATAKSLKGSDLEGSTALVVRRK